MNVFRENGYTYLIHKTRLEKIPSIVKTGYLFTGDKVPYQVTGCGLGGNRYGKVFFSAIQHQKSPENQRFHSFTSWRTISGGYEGDLKAITLVFQLNVLQNAKYHVSCSGMRHHGDYAVGDYRYDMPENSLNNVISKGTCGEVVLYEDVSIKQLSAIWVHPTKKDEVIQWLKNHEVSSVNGKSIEEVIS